MSAGIPFQAFLLRHQYTPERAFVVTRAGDLWQLGAHRLICGSALCKADMAALLGGELAQIVP